MKTIGRKIVAVLEVILIRFVAFPVIVWLVTEGTPRFQAWQTERLPQPFPVTGHLVIIAMSVGVLDVSWWFGLRVRQREDREYTVPCIVTGCRRVSRLR